MIDLDRLIASVLGELDPEADAEVELHVLTCDACAREYAALARIGTTLAQLVRTDGIDMPVTPAILAALDAEGLVSRRYVLTPGSIVPCSVGADDVYSLVTLEAELGGVTRVDVVRGTERIEDIPFDPRVGRVMFVSRSSQLRLLPSMKLPLRLLAVDGDADRILGDYVLDHTAFAG